VHLLRLRSGLLLTTDAILHARALHSHTQYLNEPWMHSMPAVTMSPNKKWLACQSMDNSIMMYEAGRYRLNRKKRFTGHVTSGYACQPAFSNDCNYIYSGDGEGKLFIWCVQPLDLPPRTVWRLVAWHLLSACLPA
jgi:WD40 repeat protein